MTLSIRARRSGRIMLDSINQPLLDVRDLSVAFRQGGAESVAVDKVSFSIERGMQTALSPLRWSL